MVFDGPPAALTDAAARDLYGLEAAEVVGPVNDNRRPAPMPQPGLAAARVA